MHIAMISPGWPPERALNGIATYVGHMRTGFVAQDHRVSILSTRPCEVDLAAGILPIVSGRGSRLRRRLRAAITGTTYRGGDVYGYGEVIAEALLALHKRVPVDLIEMEESFGWFADVQRITKLPTVVKLHGPAFLSFVDEARESDAAIRQMQAEGQALREARYLTSPSRITLERTIQKYALKPRRAEPISNPIATGAHIETWNRDKADAKTLLFVGRFDSRKGGDFVLRAFRRLLEFDPTLRLIFVGPDNGVNDGSGAIVKFRAYFESVFEPELRNRVTFKGPMSIGDIYALRPQCRATLVCSRWDNQPNTALEAMIQMCPLISTDSGSMPDIVQDQVNGISYKAEDIEDFCRAAKTVLDEQIDLTRLGESARDYVLREHDPIRAAEKTIQFYRYVASN